MSSRPVAVLSLALLLAPAARAAGVDPKADLARKDARIKELEGEVADYERDMGVERGKTNALSAKALELEKLLEEALAQGRAKDARIAELEKELAAAKARIAELERLLAAANARIAEMERELAAAKARIAELERLLAEAAGRERISSERIVELERQLGVERDRRSALEKRVGELEAKNGELLRQNGALEATVASTRDALAELQKRKAEADARVAEFRQLIAKFKSLIDAGKLRVKIVDGRMVVELATDVLFASGSAELSRDGRAAIVEVSQVLATIPDRKFQVEGHTDNVPISTERFASNWELAAARAITVVKTMITGGLQPTRISAASYADVRPAMPNDTKEGKRANRRIEITLVPDLSSLPGFDELNRVSSTN